MDPLPLPATARRAVALLALALAGFAPARARAEEPPPAAPPAPAAASEGPVPSPADADAARLIHNFRRLAPGLLRGAAPETDADFAALARAGVTSILTVDGAKPDVEAARRHGIRYVHLPFGYDGIPRDKQRELVKTYRILAAAGGGIFVHCHHGKHRGPAAAAIGLCVLAGATPEQGVAEMRLAGTDPRYRGLYESVLGFRLPTDDELKDVRADLPSVAPVPALATAMVSIDAAWERLRLVKAAAWSAPPEHPDVDPAHEATMLAELWRELARRPDVAREPEAFRRHVAESESAAWALAKALSGRTPDATAASGAFARGAATCAACHTAFRDVRRREGAPAPAAR